MYIKNMLVSASGKQWKTCFVQFEPMKYCLRGI